jgi:hypothetical protein
MPTIHQSENPVNLVNSVISPAISTFQPKTFGHFKHFNENPQKPPPFQQNAVRFSPFPPLISDPFDLCRNLCRKLRRLSENRTSAAPKFVKDSTALLLA